MKTKCLPIIILMFAMIPIVLTDIECQISTDNITFLTIDSSLFGGCVDDTNNIAYIQDLNPSTNYHIRCRNETDGWGYIEQRTERGGKNIMADLSIMIFILSITGALYIAPFFVKFSKFQITNLIIKRGSLVIATYLMVLNSSIAATIAEAAGLDLTREMFAYMWFFGIFGWLALTFLIFKTLFDVIKLWSVKKKKIREEYDEHYYEDKYHV